MEQSTNRGFISIRNEDGTQWLCEPSMWGPRAARRPHSQERYRELEGTVEESKKRDCPDNGFFGLWNLTWHPCTEEEALAQEARADALDREAEEEVVTDLGDGRVTRYEQIKAAWALVREEGLDLSDLSPPSEARARLLDEALGELFEEPVQQWNDGLINASELFDKLVWLAFAPALE